MSIKRGCRVGQMDGLQRKGKACRYNVCTSGGGKFLQEVVPLLRSSYPGTAFLTITQAEQVIQKHHI